jgi:hypothetical protein
MRRPLVRLLTFVGGLFFLLEFLLPTEAPPWLGGFENPLTPLFSAVTNFVVVVGTMAFLLGPINLVRSHVRTLRRERKGRLGSVVFLVFLVGGVLATALKGDAARNVMNLAYDALFYGVLTAFFAASMALLAFYLVSAAHRAFRLNSLDAGLMMASAAVILLGQVPVGEWLTAALPEGSRLRDWAQWILFYPNTGVQRAVLIGACAGALATALRHWLGLGTRRE